jgi:hypothetical protein
MKNKVDWRIIYDYTLNGIMIVLGVIVVLLMLWLITGGAR